MSFTEKLLSFLLILALPIRLWGLEFGFYIYAVDFFAIITTAYYCFFKEGIKRYNRVQLLLILHSLWIIIVSVLSIVFYGSQATQIFKGDLQLLLYDIFFIFFIQRLKDELYLNYITKVVLLTGLLVVPLSLINFYTKSVFGVDFINDFIRALSIGDLKLEENHLKLTFWIRNSSFAGEPNFLGIYFVFLLQIILIIPLRFFLKQSLVLLLLISILTTFSRAAILCGLVIYFSWTLYFIKRTSFNGRILIFLIFLALGSLWVFRETKSHEEIEYAFESLNSRSFSSDDQRLNIYSQAINIFYEHPLGVGPSNYSVYANRLYGNRGEENPHNSFLTVLVEEGLLGVLLMVLLLTNVILDLYKFTNIFSVIGVLMFLLSMLGNDFYKISGYKFFIFFTYYLLLYKAKGHENVETL